MAARSSGAALTAKLTALVSVVSSQPSVASMPARASRPRMIRPGYRSAADARNSGSRTARVPRMTWETPASRYRAMMSRLRIPPPICTGISPSSRATAVTRAPLRGSPANAPSRSTRCSRRQPCSAQCAAMANGSSENTVASSIRPRRSRTHWPSFMSMAGMRSI